MPTRLKNSLRWPSGLSILLFAKGGGRGGGGRGGGSRVGGSRSSSSAGRYAAPSRTGTQYGSSGGTGYGSSTGVGRTSGTAVGSSGTGSSATRWGSSASSGRTATGTGFSSSGNYGSRPGSSAGAAYRAPSKTYSKLSSPGAARSSAASRPQAHVPTAAAAQPTRVVYSTTYVNNYGRMGSYGNQAGRFGSGSLLMAGGAGLIGGYYLGRMMGSMSRPYYGGYGYGGYGGYYGPSPYQTYVPYRERYGTYYQPTTPSPLVPNQAVAPAEPKKEVDLCTLARWNRELPFTELPNMALEFLSNDTISGNSTADKAKFVYDFFKSTTNAYASYNSSADIFTIPAAYDLNKCNFLPTQNFALVTAAPAGMDILEEPIVTSARSVLSLYSNISKDQDNLADLVAAAKACLPRSDVISQPEVLPCLDFSLNPEQLLAMENPKSVFGNQEICHRQLNPDLFKCTPKSSDTALCNLDHLLTLNSFARNYYLCKQALEDDTLNKLQLHERSVQEQYAGYNSARRMLAGSSLWSVTLAIGALAAVILRQ